MKRWTSQRSRKLMSSDLSAQYWDTTHPNVPTKKMIKQSSLEDKESYLKEYVLLAKKKTTRLLKDTT
jgi:hypothetical protein